MITICIEYFEYSNYIYELNNYIYKKKVREKILIII